MLGLMASIGICLRWWLKADAAQREAAAGYALALVAFYFPLNTHKEIFSSELSITLWMLIALYVAAIRQTLAEESTDMELRK